jgi:cellulase/cellobiase CelA1
MPPSTPPSTPADDGTCAATYTTASQWPGGFQGQVTLTNRTARVTMAWTVALAFTHGQQITQVWNATATQTGATVTATNVSWNGVMPSGSSTSFGFTGSTATANTAPAVTCTVT